MNAQGHDDSLGVTTTRTPTTQTVSLHSELWGFIEMTVPIILVNLGMITSPMLCASFIGRKFEPVYLSGFCLANLTGNLCVFALLSGLLSAADTLGPQAYGSGNRKELGLIAMRGMVYATAILLPINVFLVNYLGDIFLAFGQDEEAVIYGVAWYRIFVWSFPFCVVYNVVFKFLSAQNMMRPIIIVSLGSFGIVLPVGLEIMTENFGFLGSAWAYVIFQGAQAISLLVYLYWKRPHDAGTWPGFGYWKHAILAYEPMIEFLRLGMGGMFAQCEWVFWEGTSLIVGVSGVTPLSAHTILSQVIMFLWLPPLSAGTALSIRMGIAITTSVKMTKKLVIIAAILTISVYALVNLIVYLQARQIIQLFTSDAEVVEITEQMWWKMCIFSQTCALFGALCGIATGLGMQWTLARINLVWLWLLALPTMYYFAVLREGGLEQAWTCINLPYLGINLSLLIVFGNFNWESFAEELREKNLIARDSEEERGILLV